MMARFLALTATEGGLMKWNKEPVPFLVALQIGWNLPMDVVGAGVYGGIVKRDSNGKIIIGDEWPEDNRAPPAHNPVHSTGPYLDFSKLTQESRGYTKIATVIMAGKVANRAWAPARSNITLSVMRSCSSAASGASWTGESVFLPSQPVFS